MKETLSLNQTNIKIPKKSINKELLTQNPFPSSQATDHVQDIVLIIRVWLTATMVTFRVQDKLYIV